MKKEQPTCLQLDGNCSASKIHYSVFILKRDGFFKEIPVVTLDCIPRVFLGIITRHANFHFLSPKISETLIVTALKIPNISWVFRKNGFSFRTLFSWCPYVSFWKYLIGKLRSSFQTDYLQKIFYSCEQRIMQNYLNKQRRNIKFTLKIEENGTLSFLDMTISCENNKFVKWVYRKPTFSEVFTNFEKFIPAMYNRGLIVALLHIIKLCPITRNFIGKTHNYTQNVVYQCIKKSFWINYLSK